MELTNDFRVALPVDRAWAVLTDLERIAPCMPGAQLQEVEGDDYRGVVKVKVGPITAQYKGQATFVDRDEANHVAVLRAEGRETRGQGNASATITATLTPDGDGTAVSVVTDLTVTGRVAQFGRGVLADVSAKLLDQFVESLEQTVLADETGAPESMSATPEPATAAPATGDESPEAVGPETSGDPAVSPTEAPVVPEAPSATPGARRVDHPEAQPVDLISTAGSPVAKRVGPILALVAIAWILKKLLSRSKK
jgi:carbon monoxide dehydrogenase subunit G